MHKQALKRIGLTIEDYERIFAKQKGLCVICEQPETGSKNKKLSADHCHISGVFRGLLCNRCNRAIGLFGDNPDLLDAAASYLRFHSFKKAG